MIALFKMIRPGGNQTCWNISRSKDLLKTSNSHVPVSTTLPVSHDGVWSSTLTFWEICLDVYKAICMWKLMTFH
jgi:hypothetical protein